jgi:hypothetical protein
MRRLILSSVSTGKSAAKVRKVFPEFDQRSGRGFDRRKKVIV